MDDAVPLLHRALVILKAAVLPAVFPLVNRGRPPLDDTPEAVLESPIRRAILALVEEHPGVTQLDVRTKLDLGHGSLALHVATLTRASLIETRRVGRFVRLYPWGEAPTPDDPSLVPKSAREIALLILKQPRSSQELAEAAGIAVQNVRRHLRTLMDMGLIAEDRLGTHQRYVPTDRLVEAAEQWRGT